MTITNNKRFKFKTPAVVTVGVNDKMKNDLAFYQFVMDCIYLHFSGNFGQLSADSIETNNYGIEHKESVFSNYVDVEKDFRIWIITDPGHERTTVLFPDEY